MNPSRTHRAATPPRPAAQRTLSRVNQFALTQEALGICTWIWDVERNRVEWFGDLSALLGLPPRQFSGDFRDYLAHVHPGDRERARSTFIDCLKGSCQSYRSEERILLPNGNVRWLETYGRGLYASDGRAVELAGVVRDVTGRRQQQEKYAAVFAASAHAVVIARQHDSIMLEVNEAWSRSTGYARDAAQGRSALELGLWKRSSDREQAMAELSVKGTLNNFPTQFVRADARVIDVLLSGIALVLDGVPCIVWSWSDVSELALAKERLDRALRASGVCLWDADLRTGDVYLSEGWAEMLGHPVAPTHTTISALAEFADSFGLGKARGLSLDAGKGPCGDYAEEHPVRAASGECKWILTRGKVVERDPETGRARRMVGTNVDITARKEAEARIEFLAHRDVLTGLPNRALLLDRLGHALASARRDRHTLALLLLDLDRFKNVNDSFGPQVGDVLLRTIASKLAGALREGDTLARVGGDQFAVLLEDLKAPAGAASIAQKLQAALAEAFVIEGHSIAMAASVGIAVHPTDGEDAEALLRCADAAMYHAKKLGRNTFQYYSRSLNARAVARARLELDLRGALLRDEFFLRFQPIFAAFGARPVGVEALLRWRHPQCGVVSPDEFIPVAEDMGIMPRIGDWVLERALGQLASWHAAGYRELAIAVNVSPRQLAHGEAFAARIEQLLETCRLPGRCLEIEITETSFVHDMAELSALLSRVAGRGVRVALDDFGTGYSSMAYLQRLPFHTLKIDRTFVSQIDRSEKNVILARTIVAMAKTLALKVVAEGVETHPQYETLRELGCQLYQGHFFSKPLSAEEFARRFLAGAADDEGTQ